MQNPERLNPRAAGILLRDKAPEKKEIRSKGAANVLSGYIDRMSQLNSCGMGAKELEEYVFGREIKLTFLIIRNLNNDLFEKRGWWIDVLQTRVMGRLLFYLREGYPHPKRKDLMAFSSLLLHASAGHLWRDEPEYARDLAEIYLQVFPPKDKAP